MSEIQATLNFHVQFGNFVNIDLFQRGFYQLRCSVDTSIKASQVEFANALPNSSVTLMATRSNGRNQQQGSAGNSNSNQTQIIFMSKPFLINYKKQEVKVNEAFEFRLHLLVDTDKIEECIDASSYTLNIELWSFSISPSDPINPDFKEEMLERMEHCCTRSVRFHFVSSTGLFHYIPVFFDYFHLSVVGLSVFGMLLAIHQPYLGFLRQSRNASAVGKFAEQSTLEAIFFGSPQLSSAIRLQRSLRIHSTICSLLLRSLDSLQRHFDELSALLHPDEVVPLDSNDRVNCADRLAKLTEILGQLQAEEDVLQMANTQIAQLCAANVVLWSQFISMARLRPEIELYLATIHAKLRRRRFLEAFLSASFPKRRLQNSSAESRNNSHSARAAIIRQSEYLRSLPVLPLQQTDLDESSSLHPIIFEDVYSADITEEDMIAAHQKQLQQINSISNALSTEESLSATSKPNTTTTPGKNKKTNSSSSSSANISQQLQPVPSNVKATASATELSRNSSSASSLSTNGTTSNDQKAPSSKGKLWSVKRKSKHTLRNEVADFGKKQPVTVIGVRWRRSDDDLMPLSPAKSVNYSSVPQTPIFADSPPPSVPAQRTNKFGNSALDDDRSCPAAGVSKQRRFKSLIESPTNNELSEIRLRYRNSCQDGESVSPVFEPVTHTLSAQLENNRAITVEEEPSIWCEPILALPSEIPESAKETEVKADVEPVVVTNGNSTSESPQPLSTTASYQNAATSRGRSNSYDVSVILGVDSNNQPNGAPCVEPLIGSSKKVPLRKSSSFGCIPLSPQPETYQLPPFGPDGLKLAPLSMAVVDMSSLSSIGQKQSSEDFGEQDAAAGGGAAAATENDIIQTNGAQFVLRLNSESETDEQSGSVSSSLSHTRDRAETFPQPIEPEPVDNRSQSHFTGFWNEKLTLQEMLTDMEAIDEVTSTGGACLETSMCSTSTAYTSTTKALTTSFTSMSKPSDSVLGASSSSSISMLTTTTVNGSQSGFDRSSSSGLISQTAFSFSTKFVRAKEHVQRKIGVEYRGAFCSDRFMTTIDDVMTPAELPLAYFCTQFNGAATSGSGTNGHIDLDDLGTGFVGRPYNGSSTGKPVHLVVCVHGLEGNCCDLRLVRAYLELLLPDQRFKFLMSTSNQSDTFTDVDRMADNLVHEVQLAYNSTRSRIIRISFIGHSLGTLIIRAALAKPAMIRFRERFYTFLSLSGPHLGTLYSTSSLVNMGIWLIQKWKKSSSLLQMSLRDHADVRQTFLYKLSQKPGLEYFRNVLFVGSHQDHYVPYHSARIEVCRMAAKDTSSAGVAYREMVDNILRPLADPTSNVVNVARFDCYFSLPSGADNLIGRAAHVAVLDSDLFLEKFFTVIARKYFV